jgi:hypothetical protein
MRVVRRRLSPGEFDHELVWLVISVTAIAIGAIWLRLGLPTMRCPFLAMTGYPCLTCGATRCSIALAHANFGAALDWNPLATIALCGLALFNVYALIVLLARLPRLRIVAWTQREKTVARIIAVAVLLLNWAYLLFHQTRY